MPVSAISAVQGVTGTGYRPAVTPVQDQGGEMFAGKLSGAVDGLQQMQSTSKDLALKAVTGELTDVHAATIAATQSSVALEMFATFRNKAVDGVNEIFRMQA
jgi:flagellar hook-basal body complex protein FliE